MPSAEMLTVFTYDISSDRTRRAVARLLDGETARVQYSVFEGRLSQARARALARRIDALLGPGDSLRVYAVGADGLRRSSTHGAAAPFDTGAGHWLL
jgi:CRISPR-associated protein Cas2